MVAEAEGRRDHLVGHLEDLEAGREPDHTHPHPHGGHPVSRGVRPGAVR
jgi:hypothetical protein